MVLSHFELIYVYIQMTFLYWIWSSLSKLEGEELDSYKSIKHIHMKKTIQITNHILSSQILEIQFQIKELN